MSRSGPGVCFALFLAAGVPSMAGAQGGIVDVVVVAESEAEGLAAGIASIGGVVTHRYEHVPALVARVPAARLAQLRALPGVASVEKDGVMTIEPPQARADQIEGAREIAAADLGGTVEPFDVRSRAIEPQAYLNYLLTGAAGVWTKTDFGAGSVVAVVDSGTHPVFPCLDGAVIGAPGFPDGYDAIGDNPATANDNHPHGTWVGGTIASACALTLPDTHPLIMALEAPAPSVVVPASASSSQFFLLGVAARREPLPGQGLPEGRTLNGDVRGAERARPRPRHRGDQAARHRRGQPQPRGRHPLGRAGRLRPLREQGGEGRHRRGRIRGQLRSCSEHRGLAGHRIPGDLRGRHGRGGRLQGLLRVPRSGQRPRPGSGGRDAAPGRDAHRELLEPRPPLRRTGRPPDRRSRHVELPPEPGRRLQLGHRHVLRQPHRGRRRGFAQCLVGEGRARDAAGQDQECPHPVGRPVAGGQGLARRERPGPRGPRRAGGPREAPGSSPMAAGRIPPGPRRHSRAERPPLPPPPEASTATAATA